MNGISCPIQIWSCEFPLHVESKRQSEVSVVVKLLFGVNRLIQADDVIGNNCLLGLEPFVYSSFSGVPDSMSYIKVS